MKNFKNLTEHSINFFSSDGSEFVKIFHGGGFVIPPSGEVLRLEEERQAVPGDFPLDYITFKNFDLPQMIPDTFQIISLPVLMAIKLSGRGRKDFISVDISKGTIRDATGKIVGVRGFLC